MSKRGRGFGDQGGSVSVISIALGITVLLLLMVFLEREWTNYLQALAEQTADFAAEAGSRWHELSWEVYVSGFEVYRDREWYCAQHNELGECLVWDSYWVNRTRFWDDSKWAPEAEWRDGDRWREIFDCWPGGGQPPPGRHACTSRPQPVQWRFDYTPEASRMATQTFDLNWQETTGAEVRSVRVRVPDGFVADAGDPGRDRKVTVTVTLRLRSLFGLWPRRERQVTGMAVPRIEPLSFSD